MKKILIISLIALFLLSGCSLKKSNKINTINELDLTTISNPNEKIILPLEKLEIFFEFNSIDCAKNDSQNKGFNNYVLNYCNKNFNSNILDKDDFITKIEIEQNWPFTLMDKETILLVTKGHSGIDAKKVDNYVEKYFNYFKNLDEFYKVSLYLKDKNTEKYYKQYDKYGNEKPYAEKNYLNELDLLSQRILTPNTLNLKKEELKYWNHCEAGCPIWPIDIIDNYIVWHMNLTPCSGAACICGWGNETNYESMNQVRCELMLGLRTYLNSYDSKQLKLKINN
ncbi:hypothetical protein K8R66_03695 [bacterium]|nr:hypothetical protein [bacterium]